MLPGNSKLYLIAAALSLQLQAALAEDFYYGAGIGYGSLQEQARTLDTGVVANDITAPEGLALVGQPQVGFDSMVEDDSSINWKIFGGYNLTRNYAVEGGYINFGKSVVTSNLTAEITTTLPDPLMGTQTSDAALASRYTTGTSGFTISGVARYPFLDAFNGYNFSVYAKGGAIWWDTDIELDQTAMPFTLQTSADEDPPAASTSTGRGRGGDSGINFVFGLGADYKITMDIGVSAEWSYFRGIDGRDLNTFSVGAFYLFRL